MFARVSGRERLSLLSDRSGATAVEFAMVAAPLFAVLFGLIQCGWALHCASNVRFAVDASARRMAIQRTTTEDDLRLLVGQRLFGASLEDVDLDLTLYQTNGVDVAQVDSVYLHHLAIPLLPEFTLRFTARVITPVAQI